MAYREYSETDLLAGCADGIDTIDTHAGILSRSENASLWLTSMMSQPHWDIIRIRQQSDCSGKETLTTKSTIVFPVSRSLCNVTWAAADLDWIFRPTIAGRPMSGVSKYSNMQICPTYKNRDVCMVTRHVVVGEIVHNLTACAAVEPALRVSHGYTQWHTQLTLQRRIRPGRGSPECHSVVAQCLSWANENTVRGRGRKGNSTKGKRITVYNSTGIGLVRSYRRAWLHCMVPDTGGPSLTCMEVCQRM